MLVSGIFRKVLICADFYVCGGPDCHQMNFTGKHFWRIGDPFFAEWDGIDKLVRFQIYKIASKRVIYLKHKINSSFRAFQYNGIPFRIRVWINKRSRILSGDTCERLAVLISNFQCQHSHISTPYVYLFGLHYSMIENQKQGDFSNLPHHSCPYP